MALTALLANPLSYCSNQSVTTQLVVTLTYSVIMGPTAQALHVKLNTFVWEGGHKGGQKNHEKP